MHDMHMYSTLHSIRIGISTFAVVKCLKILEAFDDLLLSYIPYD